MSCAYSRPFSRNSSASLASSYLGLPKRASLAEKIPANKAAIQKPRDTIFSTDGFIAKAKRYTDIMERTPELLRLFIQKIVVHEKSTKWFKNLYSQPCDAV